MITVSIIIPTYNVEAYIRECLESVAAQTYGGNIECIIVDDCGTDNSIAVAEQFIAEYKGCIDFRILHREKNGGLSAARNSGMKEACGDYIYFLDSDDFIEPHTIENMVKVAERYTEVDVVQAGITDTSSHLVFDAVNCTLPDMVNDVRQLQGMLLMPSMLPVSSWNKLIRRRFLSDNNILFCEGVIHDDVDFAYKMANCISSLALCRANTYIYRTQRPGSIINTSNSNKSLQSRLVIYRSCLSELHNIDYKLLSRSLFVRVLFIMQYPPTSVALLKDMEQLCEEIVSRAGKIDTLLMRLYMTLPSYVQKRGAVYGLFSKFLSRI